MNTTTTHRLATTYVANRGHDGITYAATCTCGYACKPKTTSALAKANVAAHITKTEGTK